MGEKNFKSEYKEEGFISRGGGCTPSAPSP